MMNADAFPQPTLYRVLNTIMGVVGNWIAGTQLRREVGQLLIKRLCDVQEMWVRFEAGTLNRRTPRVAQPVSTPEVVADFEEAVATDADAAEADEAKAPARVRATGQRLPYKFGWLLKHMKWDASPCTVQLQALLEQPKFAAFHDEFPNVARKLRPICRAFGVDTVLLRLPRKVRVPKPWKPRVRTKPYFDFEYRTFAPGEPRYVLRIYKNPNVKRGGFKRVKD